jgi:hypothetical protein
MKQDWATGQCILDEIINYAVFDEQNPDKTPVFT